MSISPGVIPDVSRPPTTTSFSARAAAGSSHSNVTPTRSSPRPSAYTISVADGSRDTRRTAYPAWVADAVRRAGHGRGLGQAKAECLKRARVVTGPLPRGDAALGGQLVLVGEGNP